MSERSVLLQAVGDIMLGDHPLNTGRGAHSTFRSQPADFPFAHVASTLARADLVFGNLECTLSEHGLRRGDHHSMQLRGQLSYVESLRRAGFGVLCVANNHSMQHGRESFLETVDALRSAGIAVCGLAGDLLPDRRARGGREKRTADCIPWMVAAAATVFRLGSALCRRLRGRHAKRCPYGQKDARLRRGVAALGRRVRRPTVAGRDRTGARLSWTPGPIS